MIILAVLLAVLAGAAIVLSRIINATLAKHIGFLSGTGINATVGAIVSLAYFLIRGSHATLTTSAFASVPLWAYLGGIVGVAVVILSSYLTPRLPVFYMTLLMFLGQIGTSLLIDWMVLASISPGKLIGAALVLAGLLQNMLVDRKTMAI